MQSQNFKIVFEEDFPAQIFLSVIFSRMQRTTLVLQEGSSKVIRRLQHLYQEIFYYTNYFLLFDYCKNTRLVKVALLWDFRLFSYFMYQILMSQAIPLCNKPKTFRIIYFVFAKQGKYLFFSKQKTPFFTFLFFYTSNLKKVPQF